MDGGDTLTSMTPLSPVDEVTVTSQRPLDAALTLSPHQRGPGDPAHRRSADGAIWASFSRQLSGPVSLPHHAVGSPYGPGYRPGVPGATEFSDRRAEALLGLDDEGRRFCARASQARRSSSDASLICASAAPDASWEALVPAILEQRVQRHRRVCRMAPAADQIRGAPTRPRARRNASSTHRGPMASNAVMGIPSRERRSSEVQDDRSVRSRRRPPRAGIHVPQDRGDPNGCERYPASGSGLPPKWAQRAFGDSDALSVGDYHLSCRRRVVTAG